MKRRSSPLEHPLMHSQSFAAHSFMGDRYVPVSPPSGLDAFDSTPTGSLPSLSMYLHSHGDSGASCSSSSSTCSSSSTSSPLMQSSLSMSAVRALYGQTPMMQQQQQQRWEPTHVYISPNKASDIKMTTMDKRYAPSLYHPSTAATPEVVVKTSRYLCERDRRVILSRIDRGEKQSVLAKEYQVSRAAICNLNKHREAVMSRSDENPLAKHPKKSRNAASKPAPVLPIAMASSTSSSTHRYSSSSSMTLQPRRTLQTLPSAPSRCHAPVQVLKTQAIALLMTRIENVTTSTVEFRRCTDRIVHLLIEEALSCGPIATLDVPISDHEQVDGVHMENPPCAISVMDTTCPLLQMFRQLEPDRPTAYARVDMQPMALSTSSSSSTNDPAVAYSNKNVRLVDAQLPSTLQYHNTFILEVVSMCSKRLCAVVGKLLTQHSACASMITVVALFVAPEVIAQVHDQYPSVRFLVLRVDTPLRSEATSMGGRESPIASRGQLFMQRYGRTAMSSV